MAYSERDKYCDALARKYEERFGKSISVPFGAYDFARDNCEDFIEEMEYSLETGIPFDQDSPRWRWSTEPLPDDVVI